LVARIAASSIDPRGEGEIEDITKDVRPEVGALDKAGQSDAG
jgi:hypothetical protein